MSLLLDALKKAEQAKQAGAEGATPAEPAPAEAPAAEPLMTRDRLPDISGLELAPDDLSPPPRQPAAPEPRAPQPPSSLSLAEPEATTSAASERRPRPRVTDDNAAARDAARQVFEAKQMDYNPRRPFFITLGALAAVAVGAGVYFWWQLQPKSNFAVAKAPPPPAAAQPAAVQPPAPPAAAPAPAAAAAVPAAGPAVTPAAPAAASEPKPAAAAGAPAVAPAPPQPAALAPQRPAAQQARPTPAAPAQAAAGTPRVPVSVGSARTQVDQSVERGYEALQAGDLQSARQHYLQALRADASNRDALLGLAAIDVRVGNAAAAEARYLKVLEIDPRDPYAQAGLAGLRGPADPVQSESRIKNLIATQPDAGQLQFALGNQLAAQGRWNEAQAAYFKAFTAEPENPDFAYNLAVSLDQMRQPKLALEYYQRALGLAANRPAAFDRSQAAARVRELGG